jgi:hypothetical protein
MLRAPMPTWTGPQHLRCAQTVQRRCILLWWRGQSYHLHHAHGSNSLPPRSHHRAPQELRDLVAPCMVGAAESVAGDAASVCSVASAAAREPAFLGRKAEGMKNYQKLAPVRVASGADGPSIPCCLAASQLSMRRQGLGA